VRGQFGGTLTDVVERIAIVADDVPDLRTVVARCLETVGFTVLQAESGREASRLLEQAPCELLVTDILMPDMDGRELIAHVRKVSLATRILAISGGGEAVSAEYCTRMAKAFGSHAVIFKPFTPIAFLAAVEQALHAK
jgi:CheY-like chemotaxis protein